MADSAEDHLYPFEASKPAAIAFAILFAITFIAHIVQSTRAKILYMLPLLIGTGLQVMGYVVRYISILNDTSLMPYVISQTGIVVSPALLAAQDYMIVGRMMSYVGPEATIIPHNIITKLFVFLDVFCIIMQSSGIALFSASGYSGPAVKTGRMILIAGLILQVGAFGVFLIVAAIFDWKSVHLKGKEMRALKPLFTAFYISAVLIIGRSIYRTIEFATINFESQVQGYLWNHEWPFYVLDTVPVFIATIAFNVVHPAKYLPRKKGLRMDGTVEQPRKHWWSKAPAITDTKFSNPSETMLMNRV